MIFYHIDDPDLTIPAVNQCMAYLSGSPELAPGSSQELENGIRCTISAYQTVEESQAFWEAHKRYIDVHYVIEGEERVSVSPIAGSEVGAYHEERDYLEVKSVPQVDVEMTPGTIICLFPNDAHRTRVQSRLGKSKRVLKAIFKVPIDLVK